MDKKHFRAAVLPGDCIGPEVVSEARACADAAAEREGASIEWLDLPFSGAHYLKTGEILPDTAIDEMSKCDAMLLGAIGHPDVKPGLIERGILLRLRFHFDQYINLRPAVSLPGVPLPVPCGGIDSVVVRENTEDLYMGLGDITRTGAAKIDVSAKRGLYDLRGELDISMEPAGEFAAQVAFASRGGVERVTRYACKLARSRGERKVALATKSNAVPALYGFFEETALETAKREFPDIEMSTVNVDAMCYHLVRRPDAYGVILCPNLFGDIVSDLQAALAGGMGSAAAGNIGDGLSMFEPVHGSAPDIAGTGKANPIAAIMSASMMLRHIGLDTAAKRVESAVRSYLESAAGSERPCEFGGTATCREVGEAVLRRI